MMVKDVAKQLGVSTGLVYQLCQAGILRHTKTGASRGKITIEPADLTAYVRSCRVEAIGAKPSPEPPEKPLGQRRFHNRPWYRAKLTRAANVPRASGGRLEAPLAAFPCRQPRAAGRGLCGALAELLVGS
jgi:excisionase family DNA binding protein